MFGFTVRGNKPKYFDVNKVLRMNNSSLRRDVRLTNWKTILRRFPKTEQPLWLCKGCEFNIDLIYMYPRNLALMTYDYVTKTIAE